MRAGDEPSSGERQSGEAAKPELRSRQGPEGWSRPKPSTRRLAEQHDSEAEILSGGGVQLSGFLLNVHRFREVTHDHVVSRGARVTYEYMRSQRVLRAEEHRLPASVALRKIGDVADYQVSWQSLLQAGKAGILLADGIGIGVVPRVVLYAAVVLNGSGESDDGDQEYAREHASRVLRRRFWHSEESSIVRTPGALAHQEALDGLFVPDEADPRGV